MNVVLVVLDTARKDIFDAEATRLHGLADYTHDWCYSAAHYTLPSHAAMFTGELPSECGVHSKSTDYRQIEGETFFEQGFAESACISASGGFLSEDFNFDRLFDRHLAFSGDDVVSTKGLDPSQYIGEQRRFLKEAVFNNPFWSVANGIKTKLNRALLGHPIPRFGDYGAKAAFDEALRQSPRGDSSFLFLNVIDAHGPFERVWNWERNDVPISWTSRKTSKWDVTNAEEGEYREYVEYYRKMHRAAIQYLDQQVAEFVTDLENQLDDVAVIVTADHGEAIGEHGMVGHQDLVTSVAHVPFLIRNPGIEITTEGPLSLLDLPQIIDSIAAGEDCHISRDVAPVEKIGSFAPPEYESEFWDRKVRSAYKIGEGYRWDSMGNSYRLQTGDSYEDATTIEEVPEWATDVFPTDWEDIEEGELAEYSNEETLRSLGYLE